MDRLRKMWQQTLIEERDHKPSRSIESPPGDYGAAKSALMKLLLG